MYLPHVLDTLTSAGYSPEHAGETSDNQNIYAVSPAPGIRYEVSNNIDFEAMKDGDDAEDYVISYTWVIFSDNPDHESPWTEDGDKDELISALAAEK